MATTLGYTIVNAFTNKSFKGNPAAVIVLDDETNLDDFTLQLIAKEFRLSETAFVKRRKSNDEATHACFSLRWFTPNKEIVLCGHATLATTYVVSNIRSMVSGSERIVKFDTLSGVLTAEVLPEGRIKMELPAGETTKADDSLNDDVKDAIRAALGDNHPKIHYVGTGSGISFNKYVLIEIDVSFDLSSAIVDAKPFVSCYITLWSPEDFTDM